MTILLNLTTRGCLSCSTYTSILQQTAISETVSTTNSPAPLSPPYPNDFVASGPLHPTLPIDHRSPRRRSPRTPDLPSLHREHQARLVVLRMPRSEDLKMTMIELDEGMRRAKHEHWKALSRLRC